MNWYLEALKKYATFSGRARRKEYWMFTLVSALISIAFGIVDAAIGWGNPQTGVSPLSGLYGVAVLLPTLAVLVRRLHDTGRTGFWFWIILVPLIGVIVLLVFLVLDSQPGANEYGPNPKEVAPEAAPLPA